MRSNLNESIVCPSVFFFFFRFLFPFFFFPPLTVYFYVSRNFSISTTGTIPVSRAKYSVRVFANNFSISRNPTIDFPFFQVRKITRKKNSRGRDQIFDSENPAIIFIEEGDKNNNETNEDRNGVHLFFLFFLFSFFFNYSLP